MLCIAAGMGILAAIAFHRAHRHRRCSWRSPLRCHRDHSPWWLARGFAEIDASPAQERVIAGELDKLRTALWAARRDVRATRGDLAAALRGPVIDDAALGVALGRLDAATASIRAQAIEAMRTIHAALDDGQRARLADWLEHGAEPWRRSPYR
jgi:uncharacterized membrane protein